MSDSNLGGGLAGGENGGLGSTGGGLSGASGSTGGELRGAGQLGSTGEGFTEGGVYTTGDDFDAHDGVYQRHYSTTTIRAEPTTPVVTTYDEARTGYAAGHRAAANPAYANREYEEVEVEIEREYPQPGRFGAVRGYAKHAFEWKRVVGALALAGGAYWVGRKLFDAVQEMGADEEQDCRTYYDSHPVRASVPYDHARTVYVVGYVAARNPEYAGRSYDDVEPHLRGGFTGSRAGSYDALRDFGRRGYERGTSRTGTVGAPGSTGSTGTSGLSGTTGI